MNISLEWLSEFLTWTEKDPQAIADKLTLCTAEVENVLQQGALLDHCCVGKVLSIGKHPNADKLLLAKVETDKGEKQVVCGGTNVREGMLVAFAHIGATVSWHGEQMMTLEPIKIRGEKSEGMICAAEELGLETLYEPTPEDGEHPIIDLSSLKIQNSTLKTGDSLREALNLNDTILDINNTAITMRPDLFSHIGIARECVALGLATWKKKPSFSLPTSTKKNTPLDLALEKKSLAPRYLSCMLSIDGLGETPEWMRKRLEAVGLRSVSLPVDITNYVTQEMGVPMHCFDADDIAGTVHIRQSKKGEAITTLDKEKRTLPEGALVMSDDEGIFDLLGIMGGLRSSTKETTKHIYLHAASLDPDAIRTGVAGTNHRTHASTVYEKTVPAITVEQGFTRALELFLELVPKATITSSIESMGDNGKERVIALDADVVRSTLGVDVSDKEMIKILESLECDVKETRSKKQEANILEVTIPLHRYRDLLGPHDLIEEIGRVYGFDRIEPIMPSAQVQLPTRDMRIHAMRDALKSSGYYETLPLSFVSRALLQACNLDPKDAIAVQNPIGEETSLLQTSLLPTLLKQAAENLLRTESESLNMFRWSHVFSKTKDEHMEMALVRTATKDTGLQNDPFLLLCSDIRSITHEAGYTISMKKPSSVPSYAHPTRCASICVGKKDIGTVCEIHPAVCANFHLPHRTAVVVINIEELFALEAATKSAKAIPAFPAITYDITIERSQQDATGPLINKLQESSPLLEDVHVQDVYAKGSSIDPYKLTLRFTYRSADKTLTEDEAKKEHDKVLAAGGIG